MQKLKLQAAFIFQTLQMKDQLTALLLVAENGTVVPLVVTEGNTIMYTKGAGQSVKVENVEHLILTEDQILAIVE
jgi:co-chaperonin GroES (HSP10)